MSTCKYQNKLRGKRVLILGGTSGIGFAVAEACIEFGAIVYILGSKQDKLEKALQRLKDAYPEATQQPEQRIHGTKCDLSQTKTLEGDLDKLLDTITAGRKLLLDHVVFTAGDMSQMYPMDKWTADNVLDQAKMRTVAPLLLAKLLPKYIVPGSNSSFTLTGGVLRERPMPGSTLMAVWVSALQGIVRGLSVDLKPLRVNVVEPGLVETELWDSIPFPREQARQMGVASTTVARVGSPEDTAEAYLYLMRDGYVAGTSIATNGGSLLM